MKLTERELDSAQRRRVSRFITEDGGAWIDTALLLETGAIAGPYRRTRPLTVTWRMRVIRALRSLLINRRSPL